MEHFKDEGKFQIPSQRNFIFPITELRVVIIPQCYIAHIDDHRKIQADNKHADIVLKYFTSLGVERNRGLAGKPTTDFFPTSIYLCFCIVITW